MKRVTLALLFLLLVGCVSAPAGSALADPTIPTFTTTTGPVIDVTESVQPGSLQRIREAVDAFNNGGSQQMVIAIFNNCTSEEIQIATQVGNQNGIGSRERDDGIVIAVFVDKEGVNGDKPSIGVAIGSGLEGDLNDAKVGRLLDATYVPARTDGEWEKGLVEFISATRQVLDGQSVEEFQPPPQDYTLLIVIGGVIMLLVLLDLLLNQGSVTLAILLILSEANDSSSSKSGSSKIGGGGGFRGGGVHR